MVEEESGVPVGGFADALVAYRQKFPDDFALDKAEIRYRRIKDDS